MLFLLSNSFGIVHSQVQFQLWVNYTLNPQSGGTIILSKYSSRIHPFVKFDVYEVLIGVLWKS